MYENKYNKNNKKARKNCINSKINYDQLANRLRNFNWDTVYEKESAKAAANIFMDILDNEIKNCTTTHKYKVKKRKIWTTNGLIKSMCTRDKMYQKLLKEPDNIALKQNYTQYKNYVKIPEVTKLQYYRNKIQENAQNSSNLWNTDGAPQLFSVSIATGAVQTLSGPLDLQSGHDWVHIVSICSAAEDLLGTQPTNAAIRVKQFVVVDGTTSVSEQVYRSRLFVEWLPMSCPEGNDQGLEKRGQKDR
ncbi:hypothetical protein JTB14_024328 [Gonioctena quinquepunctata]|nr:hypothetical protein JTB14_024328 [Gonioctena quinquepunctata]